MKRVFVFLLLMSIVLSGCSRTADQSETSQPPDQLHSNPTLATEALLPTEEPEIIPVTIPATKNTVPAETEPDQTKVDPTNPSDAATEPTSPTKPTDTEATTEPQKQETEPPKQEENSPTQPSDPAPEATPTNPTQPETTPTDPTDGQEETQPTESTESSTEETICSHDWACIHHAEEGHWKAGVVCDCGWTVYGNPDELIALWNAHSASYPAAESLFDHGGYGCVDEWIVDKPAYDEWVCRLCGEPKA